MPSSSSRQLDYDTALAEMIDQCRRPADANRLTAAAVRLRRARIALDAPDPAAVVRSHDIRAAELGVLAAASELAGGRASQNRVIEAYEALVAARTAEPGDPTPDEDGRRWPLGGGPVEGVSLTLPDAPDEDVTVWLDLPPRSALFPDQAGLGVDQADALADALAAAVRAARGAEQ